MADKIGIDYAPLSEVVRWPRNPKNHDGPAIQASVGRFGFTQPLLRDERTGRLVAGHGRTEALQAMKARGDAPPGRVQVRDDGEWLVPILRGVSFKDDREAEAYLLADNRLVEVGGWDNAGVAEMMADLQQMADGFEGVGWSATEAVEFVALATKPVVVEAPNGVDETPPVDPVSETGKVYQLGPHRLVCGDSTNLEVVRLVVGDEPADALFTDPPYGVSYQSHMVEGGTATRFKKIENDDLKPDELRSFLSAVFAAANKVMRAGAAAYVCHANQRPGLYAAFESAFLANGFTISAVIVWVKASATMGWQDYHSQYEPILYGWKEGAQRRKVEDRTQTNVWEVSRDSAASYVHPTQKPVELPARAIRNSTAPGDIVLDLFGGSGSTLIAAAQEGRRARLVEKDPGYCDVIRRRWGAFAQKAGLSVGDGLILPS